MSIGPPEIIAVLLVALVVLGPEQLPKAARQMGRAIAEFRRFSGAVQDQVNDMVNEQPDDEASPPPADSGDSARDLDGFRLIDPGPPPATETEPPPAEAAGPATSPDPER